MAASLLIDGDRYSFSQDASGRWGHNRDDLLVVAALIREKRASIDRASGIAWALNNGLMSESDIKRVNLSLSKGEVRSRHQASLAYYAILNRMLHVSAIPTRPKDCHCPHPQHRYGAKQLWPFSNPRHMCALLELANTGHPLIAAVESVSGALGQVLPEFPESDMNASAFGEDWPLAAARRALHRGTTILSLAAAPYIESRRAFSGPLRGAALEVLELADPKHEDLRLKKLPHPEEHDCPKEAYARQVLAIPMGYIMRWGMTPHQEEAERLAADTLAGVTEEYPWRSVLRQFGKLRGWMQFIDIAFTQLTRLPPGRARKGCARRMAESVKAVSDVIPFKGYEQKLACFEQYT